jgi:hypothetical protein
MIIKRSVTFLFNVFKADEDGQSCPPIALTVLKRQENIK